MSARSITILRWLAALIALAFTVLAAWLAYLTLFVLERFGLMTMLSGLALFSAATILWWFIVEGHIGRVRTRIRHIVSGALLLAAIGVIVSIRLSWPRLDTGFLSGITFEGPVGFIIGGNLGAMYSLLRLRGTPAV